MVSNTDVLAFLVEFRSEIPAMIRRELNLQKLQNPTPTELKRRKKLKLLDELDKSLGPGSPWQRARHIRSMLNGTTPAPAGLEGVVHELKKLGCTKTQQRIHDLLTRD